MHTHFRLVFLTALLASFSAFAEQSPVNIHLDMGGGTVPVRRTRAKRNATPPG